MMLSLGRRLGLAVVVVLFGSFAAFAEQSAARPVSSTTAGDRPSRSQGERSGAQRDRPSRGEAEPRAAAVGPWWKDDQFKKDLGLTADQSTRIDAIFQATLPQLRQGYDELDRVEDKLSHLIESNADETLVTRQIDRVETVRSNLHKTRTLMHLHMRQVLTPEQRQRFSALLDRRQSQIQLRQPPSAKHTDE